MTLLSVLLAEHIQQTTQAVCVQHKQLVWFAELLLWWCYVLTEEANSCSWAGVFIPDQKPTAYACTVHQCQGTSLVCCAAILWCHTDICDTLVLICVNRRSDTLHWYSFAIFHSLIDLRLVSRHCQCSVVHRPVVVSIQFCFVLMPPSYSSCTLIHHPRVFFGYF